MAETRSIAAQKRAHAALHQAEMTGTVNAPVPSFPAKQAAQRQQDQQRAAQSAALTAQHKARQNAKVHKTTKKGK